MNQAPVIKPRIAVFLYILSLVQLTSELSCFLWLAEILPNIFLRVNYYHIRRLQLQGKDKLLLIKVTLLLKLLAVTSVTTTETDYARWQLWTPALKS